MNQIDMGIACAYVDVLLSEQGKSVNFKVDLDHNQYVKDDYQYVITCQWKK